MTQRLDRLVHNEGTMTLPLILILSGLGFILAYVALKALGH